MIRTEADSLAAPELSLLNSSSTWGTRQGTSTPHTEVTGDSTSQYDVEEDATTGSDVAKGGNSGDDFDHEVNVKHETRHGHRDSARKHLMDLPLPEQKESEPILEEIGTYTEASLDYRGEGDGDVSPGESDSPNNPDSPEEFLSKDRDNDFLESAHSGHDSHVVDDVTPAYTSPDDNETEVYDYFEDYYDYEDDDEDDDEGLLPAEQRLMRYLMRGYERSVRPVRNASDVVLIRMGLTMTQIFDMVSRPRLYYF